MRCLKCNTEIKIKGLRTPRKCCVCGAKFEMKLGMGFLCYLIINLIFILSILIFVKKLLIMNIFYMLFQYVKL